MRTSRLAYFEAENSIRALRVGNKITAQEEFSSIETMKRYLLEGFIELWETPVKRLFPSARRFRPVLKMSVRFPAAGQPHWRRHSLVSYCPNSLLALSLPLKP
ncbi:MAG: hypothetical protein RIS79_1169, partial [Verrucomicrobiota bacterium]